MQLKLKPILFGSSKMKNTEILFNLFSLRFTAGRQQWRGLAVWFEEKQN
ncbi:hypothetical protein [Vagococcus sp. WN89Y]